jgi:hypothetical protein
MLLQVPRVSERPVAQATRVNLLSGVDQLVLFQNTCCDETLVADITHMAGEPRVD